MANRYQEYLAQRYKVILACTGLVSLIISALILSPLILLIVYPAEMTLLRAFLFPALGLALPSAVIWRIWTPRANANLTIQEGMIVVVLAWLLAIVIGAIPFISAEGMNWTQAIFESTSGWSTTGLSVLDIENASPLILFYRSVTQLAGGAGLAILMLSALAGPIAPGLPDAEGRAEQLLPHVRQSARLVLVLYASYIMIGTFALKVVGMNWFDAVNHAFAALSTGGFSTHAESIAYWQSPAIEAVIIVLMFLGTINFLTVYTLVQRKYKAVLRNSELHILILLLLTFTGILTFAISRSIYPSLQEGARVAIFNAVAALSTTGFQTVSFSHWNGLGYLILILLMLIGGGAGSTAGGIKQYRIYVLYRGLIWEFRRRLLPKSVISEPDIWHGEQRRFIDDEHLRQIGLFVFLFLALFFIGSGVITAYGYPLQDALFEFASALSTVGLSVGITSADAPAGILWIEIFAMFLGRLEFFAIIIGLMRLIRDTRVMLFSRRKRQG